MIHGANGQEGQEFCFRPSGIFPPIPPNMSEFCSSSSKSTGGQDGQEILVSEPESRIKSDHTTQNVGYIVFIAPVDRKTGRTGDCRVRFSSHIRPYHQKCSNIVVHRANRQEDRIDRRFSCPNPCLISYIRPYHQKYSNFVVYRANPGAATRVENRSNVFDKKQCSLNKIQNMCLL